MLQLIDEQKIKKLQTVLNRLFEETNLENLKTTIEYFIKSITEFNNFNSFLKNLQTHVKELENEVEELDFVINFCEQNLVVSTKNPLKSSSNIKNLEEILCIPKDITAVAIDDLHQERKINLKSKAKEICAYQFVFIKSHFMSFTNKFMENVRGIISQMPQSRENSAEDHIKNIIRYIIDRLKFSLKEYPSKTNKKPGVSNMNVGFNGSAVNFLTQNSMSTANTILSFIKEEPIGQANEEVIYTECTKQVKERLKTAGNIIEIKKYATDATNSLIKSIEGKFFNLKGKQV